MAASTRNGTIQRRPKQRLDGRHDGAELVYLGEFALAAGLSSPWIDGDGAPVNPRMSSFVFRGLDMRGVYEPASGRMEGVRVRGSSALATLTWGSDTWMRTEFLSMIPAPKLVDLRRSNALQCDLDAPLTNADSGDSEVIFRLSFKDFVTVASEMRRTPHTKR